MNTSKISPSVSFHQHCQVFHMDFKISFQHLVLLEMISFENIFTGKTVAQKFAIHRFCPIAIGPSGGLIKIIKIELIPIFHIY